MITAITVPARRCQCDRCGHPWVSIGPAEPTHCPACRSREWNGPKRPSRAREIKLPAARKPGRPKSIPRIDVGQESNDDQ